MRYMVFPVTKLITHGIGVSLISLGPGTLARGPVKAVVNELYILRKHSARIKQPNIVQYVAMLLKKKKWTKNNQNGKIGMNKDQHPAMLPI
jgi:hypothetical protein